MDQRSAPFCYPLAPLLKRDVWDRNTLGGELQRARILVEQSQRACDSALAQVSAAEQRMRDIGIRDRMIELEARRLLHVYLEQAHVTEDLRRTELKQAHRLLEQVLAQFETQRVAVRMLETHRQNQHQDHQVEQGRSQQRAADEAWLTRMAWR